MKQFIFLVFVVLNWALPGQAATFKTEKWLTTNGARVVFYPTKEVPMLDLRIAFAAGSAYDGPLFGISALTTRSLDQGNGAFSAAQIADKLADTGAQFDSESSRDMAMVHLKTLTEPNALKNALEVFNLIVSKPNFQSDAINRGKSQQLMAIAQSEQSPDEIANTLFFNKLYHNHPYAHAVNGTQDTVKKLNAWQVREFYKHYFVAKNAVIVLVGAISREQAHTIAEQLAANWAGGEKAPAIPKAPVSSIGENIAINFPSSQTAIRLGQVGIEHANPSYFPLMVGNYILGGGALVSRLSNEVREKNGLTYGVTSQFMPMPGNGPFLISLSTRNSQAKTALTMTEDILQSYLKLGPTEEELVAAKQYLTGSFPLALASNSNIAGMLLRMAFYELPDNYLDVYIAQIEAVTVADVKQAFNAIVIPEKMLSVSVGKL